MKHIIFFFLFLLLSKSIFCQGAGVDKKIDSIIISEISRNIKSFPLSLKKEEKNGVYFCKVKFTKSNNVDTIIFLGESNDEVQQLVKLGLKKVKFNKFYKSNTDLIIPFIFVASLDVLDNSEMKINSNFFLNIKFGNSNVLSPIIMYGSSNKRIY